MSVVIIANPHSTSQSAQAAQHVAAIMRAHFEVSVSRTTHRHHACELAYEAALNQIDTVIAIGGDGTINEVVNGILRYREETQSTELPVIGVIPAGSANVFARALGMDADIEAATEQLLGAMLQANHKPVNLGHATLRRDGEESSRWFLFNAGMGLDALIIKKMESLRSRGIPATAMNYARLVASCLHPRIVGAYHSNVSLDGRQVVDNSPLVLISNFSPWSYFKSLPLVTNTALTMDERLGVYFSSALSVTQMARILTCMLSQQLWTSPHAQAINDVEHVRVCSPTPIPVQLDGDYLGDHHELTVLHRTPSLFTYYPVRA